MRWKAAGALAIASGVMAIGTAAAAGSDHRISNLDQLQWGPAPPSLPPGAEAAVMSGDPAKKGYFVIAIRGPQGYKVPPHWHSTDERVTVLSGNFTMGMGDRLDTAAGTALTAGGYAMMPRRTHRSGDWNVTVRDPDPGDGAVRYPLHQPGRWPDEVEEVTLSVTRQQSPQSAAGSLRKARVTRTWFRSFQPSAATALLGQQDRRIRQRHQDRRVRAMTNWQPCRTRSASSAINASTRVGDSGVSGSSRKYRPFGTSLVCSSARNISPCERASGSAP